MTEAERWKRFKLFIADLREVCKAHEVQIATSMHSGLEVWELIDGSEALHFSSIDNYIGFDDKSGNTK